MAGLFTALKEKITASLPDRSASAEHNSYLIALGVLLWGVADIDGILHPDEMTTMQTILAEQPDFDPADTTCVMNAIQQAAADKVDFYQYTHEIKETLRYEDRCNVIRLLFRVACADNELLHSEIELIRKIADLLYVPHHDFIDAKRAESNSRGL